MNAQQVLTTILAAVPLALVLLGWAVLRNPADRIAAPAMVGPEVLRAMAAREQRRSALVHRMQPGPLRVNRRTR